MNRQMDNVEMQQVGDKLVITVDLARVVRSSQTGKSNILADTNGNRRIPGTNNGVRVKVLVYELVEGGQRRTHLADQEDLPNSPEDDTLVSEFLRRNP